MSERQMQAVAGLAVAVGLAVVVRQLATSQGAVLGLSPAAAQGLVALGATTALAVAATRRA